MEVYSGIKFRVRRVADRFIADSRLVSLNRWAYIFSELGLAPLHARGAFGNYSYRDKNGYHFIITRTGMIPEQACNEENFCKVVYNKMDDCFESQGMHDPSSECFLHHLIYKYDDSFGCIMHGHSNLITMHCKQLGIAETPVEYGYGTRELGMSALSLLEDGHRFFQLKNHGFIAVHFTISQAADMVLTYYKRMIDLL